MVMEDVREVSYVVARNAQEVSVRVMYVDLRILNSLLEVMLELEESLYWDGKRGFKGNDIIVISE